jgi:hypothetical protein
MGLEISPAQCLRPLRLRLGVIASFGILLVVAVSASHGDDWVTWTVDDAGDVGSWASLALDQAGRAHVSYYDATNYDLRYALRDSAGWHIEVVDTVQWAGRYSSIAVDADGCPHISYWRYEYWWPFDEVEMVRHAYKDASGWHTELVEGGASTWFGYTSLTLSAGQYPHMSYNYFTEVKYAYKDAGGWHTEVTPGWGGGDTSVDLDANGYPHIAHCDDGAGYQYLWYTFKDAAGWHTEELPSLGAHAWVSVALDNAGEPHIAGDAGGELRYVYREPPDWVVETVDDAGSVGHCCSLVLDQEGFFHVSYSDATNGDLKYARQDAGGWHIERVDSIGDVGAYTSLALDADGHPHIAYYDATNQALKYASKSVNWITLSCSLDTGELVLGWTAFPSASAYWVYGASNLSYFAPGFAPAYQYRVAALSPLFRTWSSPNGIADPDSNWTYLVVAVDAVEQELCRSNRVGEHDFALTVLP